MARYTRIMTAVCLTLGALLMTIALVGVGLGAAMVGDFVHRYQQNTGGTAATTSAPVQAPATTQDAPATTPSLAPSAPAGIMDICRQAFNAGDTTTYTRLNCSLYGN
jgi:hypothetical protein